MPGASIGVNLRVTGHCNQGGRKYMEDVFSVAYQQTEDEKDLEYAFFGIFDGHGGREAALFAKEHLMDQIVSQKGFWSDSDEQVTKAIREGFIATHYAMWKELEKWPKTPSGLPSTSGTTASIVFIRRGKIYIGHVGDSAIVLGYQEPGELPWHARPLTRDHKPESAPESERISQSGGKVVCKSGVPRVVWNRPRLGHKGPVRRSTHIDEIPFLAVARSLGDLWSYNSTRNQFVVSPEPDVCVVPIDVTRHRCLILGTDGLWNMLSSEAAVHAVLAAEKHNEKRMLGVQDDGKGQVWINPSKRLVDRALELWSANKFRADNTSVVTVMLDPPGPPRSQVLMRQKRQKLSPISNRSHNHHHNHSPNCPYHQTSSMPRPPPPPPATVDAPVVAAATSMSPSDDDEEGRSDGQGAGDVECGQAGAAVECASGAVSECGADDNTGADSKPSADENQCVQPEKKCGQAPADGHTGSKLSNALIVKHGQSGDEKVCSPEVCDVKHAVEPKPVEKQSCSGVEKRCGHPGADTAVQINEVSSSVDPPVHRKRRRGATPGASKRRTRSDTARNPGIEPAAQEESGASDTENQRAATAAESLVAATTSLPLAEVGPAAQGQARRLLRSSNCNCDGRVTPPPSAAPTLKTRNLNVYVGVKRRAMGPEAPAAVGKVSRRHHPGSWRTVRPMVTRSKMRTLRK